MKPEVVEAPIPAQVAQTEYSMPKNLAKSQATFGAASSKAAKSIKSIRARIDSDFPDPSQSFADENPTV